MRLLIVFLVLLSSPHTPRLSLSRIVAESMKLPNIKEAPKRAVQGNEAIEDTPCTLFNPATQAISQSEKSKNEWQVRGTNMSL